jgi:hypothetical protein
MPERIMSAPSFEETAAAIHAVLAAADAGADEFAVLELAADANPVQIRDAYFRLARLVHPDLPCIADDPGLRWLAARAFQAVSAANAKLANPERRQPLDTPRTSISTVRRTSGAHLVPVDLVKPTRMSSASHPVVLGPTHTPTPRSGSFQASRAAMVPEPLAWKPPTPVVVGPATPEPSAGPQDAKAAATCVDVARIQMGRRDWVGAQESLQLALPVLTEPMAIAECKVMLGLAIFNNLANAEAYRLEHSKRLWNEVAIRHANTPHHGQAAYHLAVWHKLHGEPHLILHNLRMCLDILPDHTEALREKRLLSQRQFTMSDLADLEARVTGGTRRASSGKRPAVKQEAPKPSWLARLFGAKDEKR